MPVAHSAEEVVEDVIFTEVCDGSGVCCDQPAAKLPGVRFCDDSKEPTRGRLDAAQELVWAMRTGASTVPVASPHSRLHQAFPNERRLEIATVRSGVVDYFPWRYVV